MVVWAVLIVQKGLSQAWIFRALSWKIVVSVSQIPKKVLIK